VTITRSKRIFITRVHRTCNAGYEGCKKITRQRSLLDRKPLI
jgi:hypothetical protein